MPSNEAVIAARAGSIPEVLGDAGLLLDPDDTTGWCDALTRVVNDEDLRRQLAERGLARASQFTWERTARMTMNVYRRIARERRNHTEAR